MSGARDQVARLLALVPYLQTREEVLLDQAARDLGVTPEQIVADLKVLWFCGLPGLGMGDLIDVDMDALEGEGVIRLSNADYLSRPLRLGVAEASALIVALRTLREGGDESVRPVVDRTLAKLEAAAEDGAALAGRIDVQLPPEAGETARLRASLARAVQDSRQVHLSYYVPARDETTERTVDPLGLVTAEAHTYLDAWCHLAEDYRLFRLDRVSEATVLDSAAPASADVGPRDLSAGIFRPSPDDVLATLRLAPAARWVAEYYPVESASEVSGGSDAGGLEVRLRVADPAWLTRLALRLGPHVRILEPADLAEQARAAATAALAHYT